MRELGAMWRNTRMVVLCAISAALYAAVLVPFKVVPLIPGVTELRPANAIPIVCSFLFGPAAGWGSAIGNMIGDFFGGVGPGDIFGFFANLLYGYIPYKAWNVIAQGQSPITRSPGAIAKYVAACLAASVLCADIVGWGDNLLGSAAFQHPGQRDRVQQHGLGAGALAAHPDRGLPARAARADAVYGHDARV